MIKDRIEETRETMIKMIGNDKKDRIEEIREKG